MEKEKESELTYVDGVLQLDHTNIESALAASKYVFLSATTPRCGHCTRMKPAFAQAAKEVSEKTKDVVFANINCDGGDGKNKDVCREYGLKSYPSFYWHV